MRKQVELLEHHTDILAHLVDCLDIIGQLGAIDDQMAILVFFEPVDATDQRRFSGAGRPADHDALTARNLQVDIAQHVEIVAIPLVDFVENNDRFRHDVFRSSKYKLV